MKLILSKVANCLLRQLGCELVAYSRYRALVKYLLHTHPDFFFLQVGANDGKSFDAAFYNLISTSKCRGIVIEPLRDLYERLVQNYRSCPGVKPMNIALHPTQQKCLLYRVDPARLPQLPPWAVGIGSLIQNHYRKSGVPDDAMVTEEVESAHLMDLLTRCSVSKVHLIQTDVEGFDAEVIKMIDFDVIQPILIKFEHIHLAPGAAKEVKTLLKKRGYRLWREGPDTIAVSRKLAGWRRVVAVGG